MKKVLMFTIIIIMLTLTATATDVEQETLELIGGDELEAALPEAAEDILGDISLTDSMSLSGGLESLIDAGEQELTGIVRSSVSRAAALLAIVLLCTLAGSLKDTGLGKSTGTYLPLVSTLAIAAAVSGSVKTFIGLGSDTVEELNVFSKALLPALASALTAMGRGLTATGMYVAATAVSDFFITAIDKLLLPLVYFYGAAAVADAALQEGMMGRVAELIKWLATTLMKGVVLGFTAYLSVSGVISGTADAAAVKAAKVAISTVVPVVGGIISDASETVLASAGILKNAVGVFGMLAVLAVCLYPCLSIGTNYLVLKGTGALAAALGSKRESKLIQSLASALGMILAMTAVCALMLLVSCCAAIKAVNV